MEPLCIKIFSIMDRIAHDSTTDQDVVQSVYGLRRIIKGAMPSDLVRMDTEASSTPKAKQLNVLKRQIAHLLEEKADLEDQIDQLRNSGDSAYHKPGDDYSYSQVMEIIREKFGKQNGGLTLWAEFSASLHLNNPSSKLVTLSGLQTWRIAGSYPNWAVVQLLAMPVVTRAAHGWSDEDIDFLCNLHLADPHKTDDVLAAECSTRFGCQINTNMIKSKFHILRKLGRIPMRRSR